MVVSLARHVRYLRDQFSDAEETFPLRPRWPCPHGRCFGQKVRTKREAEASAFVAISPQCSQSLPSNPKGDPLEVARIAGIMAAKRTSD